ncbi:RssA protein [Actinobacillus equuli]|nr:RssA protein [Actinobacillus equuli]
MPTIHDPFDQATFAQSQMDFWVTLTNVETGEPEYFKVQDVFKEMELFRATSAMPFVSQFVEINGKNIWTVASPIVFRYRSALIWAMTKSYWF